MNFEKLDLQIYDVNIVKKCFSEYKKIFDGTINIDNDFATIEFFNDDEIIIKEFLNYVIAVDASEI